MMKNGRGDDVAREKVSDDGRAGRQPAERALPSFCYRILVVVIFSPFVIVVVAESFLDAGPPRLS
jgi:hypothetical protein